MKSAFIKIRTSPERLERIRARAGEAGKRISTFCSEILATEDEQVLASIELAQLKSQVQELVVLVLAQHQLNKVQNPEIQASLFEILTYLREFAVDRNAQIIARVTAKINSQIR